MKTTLMILTSAAVLWTTLAEAALPPNYQRLKELNAIMSDDGILGEFDMLHPVERIEHVAQDLYRITGGNCSMDVAVEDDRNVHHRAPWVRARSFVLVPKPLVCK